MIAKTIPTLDTSNLLLREIRDSELDQIASISYYDRKTAGSYEAALAMHRRICEDVESGNAIHWGIELKSEERLIGTCGFYRGFEGRRGDVGYAMKQEYRRRGLMKEAIGAVIKYGFNKLNLLEIVAYSERNNLGSIRLLEKLGFDLDLKEINGVLIKFSLRNPNAE